MVANFSIDFIKSLTSSEDDYNKGLDIFENFGTLKTVESMIENFKQYEVDIRDFDDVVYTVTLRIDMKGNLTFDKCSCKEGGCRHFVCAMLNFAKDEKSGLKNVQVQNAKKNLGDVFKNQLIDSVTIDGEKVKIFPYINFSTNEVVFKIGRRKNYIIKNLILFLNNVENNEYHAYGTNLEFRHTRKAFNEIANKYIDLIMGEYESFVVNRIDESKRSLVLKKVNMDRFFELFKDTKIYISQDGKDIESYVLGSCFEDEIPLKFQVDLESKECRIYRPTENYRSVVGIDYCYLFVENKIYRVSKEIGELINVLYKTMSILKSSEIVYTLGELDDFLSYVYPTMLKYNIVSNPKNIDELDLSKPEIYMYLDMDKGSIVATAKILYDKEKGYRDRLKESEIKQELRKYAFIRAGEIDRDTTEKDGDMLNVEKVNYRLKDSENIFFFLLNGIDNLKQMAELYISSDVKNYIDSIKYTKPKIEFKMSSSKMNNIKLIDMTISSDDFDTDEVIEILESYKQRKHFHKLRNDLYIDLNNENVKEIFNFLYTIEDDLFYTENNIISMPIYRGFFLEGMNASYDDEFLNVLNHIRNYKGYVNELDLTHIKTELRDYQKEGFAWLKVLYESRLGGILADDMGLGKTLQTICLLSSIPNVKALVVVPASIIYNWENEVSKFSDNLSITLVNGTKQNRVSAIEEDSNIYITTYEILRRDIDLYKNKQYDILIADEAQYIKNYEIQTAQAIRKIQREVTFAITGTLIENSLKELWSVFDFILPSYLYSYSKFKSRYTKSIYEEDELVSTLLRRQIAPFILRRLKKEVLKDLPDKIEQTVYCDMGNQQKSLYYAELKGIIHDLEENASDNKDVVISETSNKPTNLLAKITRLRQLCNSPNLILDKRSDNVEKELDSGKIDALLELLEQIKDNGHRPLIFSQFTSMLNLLKPHLEERGYTYFYLDGATKQQERYDQTQSFNKGEKDLFLISLKAGGTGLNLTGADVVIHIEPWWNPQVTNQATDRAYRIGQKNVIQVFKLVLRDTIEEKILELCDKKNQLAERILTNDPSLFNLTKSDIKELLFLTKQEEERLKKH